MAKDREGSVNIYGPMQAKTAEGIVAFTDGIAKEYDNGTKVLLDDLLNDLGGVIDVTELPTENINSKAIYRLNETVDNVVKNSTYHVYKDGKWTQLSDTYNPQVFIDVDELPSVENAELNKIYKVKEVGTKKQGTLLVSNPETTVEKVTFNTDLSVEEVTDILSQLTYISLDVSFAVNYLYVSSSMTNVLYTSNTDGDYKLIFTINDLVEGTSQDTIIFSSSDGGWIYPNPITINETGISDLEGILIGTENSKLLELMSMNDDFANVDVDIYTCYNFNGQEFVKLDNDASEASNDNSAVIIKTVDNSTVPITLSINEYNELVNSDYAILIVKTSDEGGELVDVYYKTQTYSGDTQHLALVRLTYAGVLYILEFTPDQLTATQTHVPLGYTSVVRSDTLTFGLDAYNIVLSYTDYNYIKYERSITVDTVATENSTNLINSNAVYTAVGNVSSSLATTNSNLETTNSNVTALTTRVGTLESTSLKKTDIKYGELDQGFAIGSISGEGDKNLFYEYATNTWKYCDTAYEEELEKAENEIATKGDITSAIGDINSILDTINGEEV